MIKNKAQFSVTAVVAVAGILTAILTGCTSSSTSKATPTALTAAEKCTPTTAKIQWFPVPSDDGHSTKNFVPVRVQVFDDTKGAAAGTERDIDIAPKTSVEYPNDPTYNWSSSPKKAWLSALTEDARLAAQVFPGFDRSKKLPDLKTAADFHNGVHLVVEEIEFLKVPFKIVCTGQRQIFGIISGVNNRAIIPEVITCGDPDSEKNAQDVRIRALALAAKYCPPAKS